MKFCNGCNQTKELTEFSKHCRMPDGLQTRCKVCLKAYNKKYYKNNREKYNAYNRKSKQRPENKKKRRARDRERYRLTLTLY